MNPARVLSRMAERGAWPQPGSTSAHSVERPLDGLEHTDSSLDDLRDKRHVHRALLHGAAMIKVVPSIDEDQAIG
jgi:hypothetical protein